MTNFGFYFKEGWHHIISTGALDHQLFILALAVIYQPKDWRRVLILVTAFTIGHSLTLALSVLDILRMPSKWVEFFIPVTIMLTALWNLTGNKQNRKMNTNYYLALFFGLIHGLGFANAIRIMLTSEESLGTGLLGFNLGLEAGQIAVVILILAISQLLISGFKIPQKTFIFVVSVLILLFSMKMAIERFPIHI